MNDSFLSYHHVMDLI